MSAVNGKEGEYYKDDGPIGHDHLHPNESPENALQKIRTAGSVSIPPDLFEKLYLSPESKVKGDLRRTFGNPTPIGLGGFLLSLSPLSCYLMNFKNTLSGLGASNIAAYLFFGGILMLVSGAMEWLLGNTFTSVVFMTFGSFWLTFGGTLQPFYGAYAAYSDQPVTAPQDALKQPPFFNSFAFFLIFMAVLCLVYLICSIRTNAIFFLILLPLPSTFCVLSASFWYQFSDPSFAKTLQIAGGAQAFVVCVLGWYLFTALMLAAVDAPFSLPVFDLSTKIKGGSEKAAAANSEV